MDKVCLFVICMYCSIHHLSAQQEEQQTQPVQQPLVTQDDILGNMNVDYAKIKLPPLSVLYENARSTPSLQILEKEKLLQKKLLSKEKRNWLGFIQAGGSASYGIADNVASNTDVNTPLIYRYVGTEQTSWNVGGGISIPFEKLFDLRGGIKRQRIQVDIAELRKQEAYETLKIQIAHLYVQILSNIETLQRSAENIALYKGASAVAEIGTARSNKVSVTLGFQELPQLEADYGKVGMQKIITTVGNVVSGSARAKETLEWLSNDIFGKVVQIKKGVTIDRDKTSINLNENMDNLVPASKISDMATGWICGQTARDFVKTKTGMGGSMNIQESEEFKTTKFFCKTDFDMAEIKKEEAAYVPLPKFYTFKSREERERILYKNFVQVGQDVKEMIKDVQNKRNAK